MFHVHNYVRRNPIQSVTAKLRREFFNILFILHQQYRLEKILRAFFVTEGATKIKLCIFLDESLYTGCFIIFSVITNIYNKKTKAPTLMELFTATGKLKKFFF